VKTSALSICFSIALLASGVAQGTLGGTLVSDTTLGIADSPWTVDSTVTVPAGITLSVDAGVRVEFDNGTGIVVDGGRMIADGTELSPILFGRASGASHRWDGFVFEDSLEDNRLTHFSMEHGDDVGHSIEVTRAKLTIQFGAWPTTEETMIEMDEPSVIIEHSAIPGISGGEVVHGKDLVAPGYLILRGNTFGKASNGGDVIDFTGAEAPGPVLQILDNIFEGGDDDGLDLDGTDAYVAGNLFMDFRKDPANTRSTTSNAVATGLPQSGAPNRTRVRLVRNVFLNCDHAVLLKEEAFLTAENNTFVGMQEAVIQFDEVGGTAVRGPGKGAILEGNLFWGNQQIFKYLIAETELTVDHCLIEPAFHDRGVANFYADPGIVGTVISEDSIPDGSPVVGAGPNGINIGYLVPAGASICGEPLPVTWSGDALLVIDGPGLVEYRYRLNGGAWSADTPIETPITLGGLTGTNSVEVLGRNAVGDWQVDPTVSQAWTVDPSFSAWLLNEVDVAGGQVEVWNHGGSAVDLNGYQLNGNLISDLPMIPAGGFTVVEVGGMQMVGGFVELRDSGAVLIDSIAYGMQIDGSTIGRVGSQQEWALTRSTLGAANQRQPTALLGGLKLNEWLLGADCLFTHDFVELHNAEGLPVALEGLAIDIEPMLAGDAWTAPALSFIGAGGYAAVIADGVQASFDGAALLGTAIMLNDGGATIDSVVNNSDQADVSGGRAPSGSEAITTFTLPTPGFGVGLRIVETTTSLVAIDAIWSYEDSDTDLGTAWRAIGFDDALWATGGALLGRETNPQNLPEPLVTEIDYVAGTPTYYFRKHFNFSGDLANAVLRLRSVVDDGAVFYLNGVELHRLRMEDPVEHAAFSSDNVSDADYEGPFELPAGSLVVGDNVIAVEVHQDDDSSSDIVFGLELDVVEIEATNVGLGDAEAILAGLRLTEIMFHPAGDGSAEFLELRNVGVVSFDLAGVKFVAGVGFTFPSLVLAPGEFVYVVKDAEAFGHPELLVAGEYSGELNDAGERLRLELGFGAGVVDMTYQAGVAIGTGGGGNSLELAAEGGLKNGRYAGSSLSGGTFESVSSFEGYLSWAGTVFTPTELNDDQISGDGGDPDGDGLVNLLEYLLGKDPKLAEADLMPSLEIEDGDVVMRYTRAVTAGEGGLELSMSTDLTSWSETIPGLSAEVVSEGDGMQTIELRAPLVAVGRGFLRIEAQRQ
jgi:hypothetical protein